MKQCTMLDSRFHANSKIKMAPTLTLMTFTPVLGYGEEASVWVLRPWFAAADYSLSVE